MVDDQDRKVSTILVIIAAWWPSNFFYSFYNALDSFGLDEGFKNGVPPL